MKSIYMLLAILPFSMATKNNTMEKNKEVVRKIYEEALNKRNFVLLKDLISPEYTGPLGVKGAEGFETPVTLVIKGFPDIKWNIEELLAEGNKVYIRWKIQGTHTGQFTAYAPTGKTVNSGGQAVYQLKDGKIIGAQVNTDRLEFLQQLGVLPLELSSPAERVRFIDKFVVPAKAKEQFLERVNINRKLIEKLPGFIEDAAYENTDEQGNLVYVTIATWENEEVLKKAKEVIQAQYKKEGFNLPEMMKQLNITVDRGVYKNAK